MQFDIRNRYTGEDGIRVGVWYRCEGGKLVEA